MVQKIPPADQGVVFKFGGGLHTRASPETINPNEAANGFNFLIDIDNRNLRSRPPFDLIGTVPNTSSVNGAACLLKSDGTISTLFQAGNTLYQWDGHTTFTSKGTCNSNCKLRGDWKSHTFNLTDTVLITDLTLTDPVYQWDGTTFSTVVFTDQNANPFGVFKAKYCAIQNERAMFANVVAGAATPQMLVGSKTSNYNEITIVNAPSDSLGTGDPYFLLSPDLKPINGFLSTYRGTMISTQQGEIFALGGTDSTNFAFTSFYANSAATGSEAIEEIGNDFIYGRQGRIESVRDTQNFGNSQAADLTEIVSDSVSTFGSWTIVFNSRTRKCYCFPSGVSQVWVLDAAIRDAAQISPWMRWTTSHALAFEPTMVMSLLDPIDGLEYIFMGDGSGNIYRMEGTGTSGDGGTMSIDTQFLTMLVSGQLDSMVYDVEGWIKYQAQTSSGTATLTFQYQGYNIFNKSVTVALQAASGGVYFSGGAHFNDGSVFNTFNGRLLRNKYTVPGHANEFQVLIEVTGVNAFSINEVGVRLRAASQ